MKYIVEITEVLQKQITVEAEDESKAIEMAKDIYHSGQEVLTAEDHVMTEFDIVPTFECEVHSIDESEDFKPYNGDE